MLYLVKKQILILTGKQIFIDYKIFKNYSIILKSEIIEKSNDNSLCRIIKNLTFC